jgi:hypothetical protein
MNRRQRINEALYHKESDKIPVDFGSTPVTGISASIVSKLRECYGLSNETPVKIIEPYQMLGEIADDLREAMGIDCVELSGENNIFGFENVNWKEWKLFDNTPVLVPELFNTKIEKDGSIFQYPEGDTSVAPSARMPKGGYYFDSIIRQPPIDESNLKVEDNLEEFSRISDKELKYLERRAEYLYKNTDYAIVANFGGTGFGDIALVPAPFLKHPKGIRDVQEWYISSVTRKDYIYEVFSRQCDIAMENLKRIYKVVQNKVSVVFISGTDFGTQRGLFISKDSYRELYKPFHKRVNDWIHKNTKWKTFIHTCGSVEPLISELIDAGFDVLNPVQCSAEGMDPATLKEKYGKDIVFWGGGVNTQKTLPFGTKEEVREEVAKRIKIFGKDGGFVFSTIHNIQAKIPIENIVGMMEAVKEF